MPRALRDSTPIPADELRELLAAEDLSHDTVLTAIGSHYGGAVAPADPLDEAARTLFGLAGRPCEIQAKRVMELLFLHFALVPQESSVDGLLLPTVLVTRHADPLVIAMLGHEIARRAGLESHVCVAGAHAWTALLDADNCTLVGTSALAGAEASESGFHVACAHETAALLVERIAHRAHGAHRRCAAALAVAIRGGHREVEPCTGHWRV